MSYPYPSGLINYSAHKKMLPVLAASSDKKQIGRFCSGLDHVSAYALDKIKVPLKKQRGSLYCSVDALYEGKDNRYYFIEFKDQPSGNVDRDRVLAKAVDSLTIGGYMFANNQTIVDTMKMSVFVLVYDNPDEKLLASLSSLAGSRGAQRDQYGEQILFGLDRLTASSFYSEVHTWTAEAFRKHFISNLP